MAAVFICAQGFLPPAVYAQSFAIDWHQVAGGGGTSTGGIYSVSGTLGQPEVGTTLTGGNYTAAGGFWTITVVQAEGAPTLRIVQTNSQFQVTWGFVSAGWVLDRAAKLEGSSPRWTLVPPAQYQTNATGVFLPVTPSVGNAFYRLRKP
jgi:hypothetical protein